MTLLHDVLAYNEQFVKEKQYEAYTTTKFPDKRLVVLTCMDTRLVELVTKAMNMRNGDIKIVRNAGAMINHPFGSIMRSLLVAVYELQADEILVIGHHDCGMSALQPESIIEKMKERGITEETLKTLQYSGFEPKKWLQGFDSVEENVRHSVSMVENHPLLPNDVPVHGLIIDPDTGKLDLVTSGYK
ncbi:beta-class carbonic anhydrase [Bacillus fonticola]|uniref:beta-class carbonic anhydrase n=1 Tax=Bacillus fonticola TaxID=2728853 RepID=UPI0014728ABD|nr:carbonic anhydrase [Bacillus fonticola]